MHVIVADVTQFSGEGIQKELEPHGIRVEVATGAADTFRRLESSRSDALLLNMSLPERSGFALCQQIREHEQLRDLPVIILTASDSELDRIMAFEAGADDVVQSPFSPHELALRLQSVKRRTLGSSCTDQDTASEIVIGDLQIDAASCSVRVRGESIALSRRELEILLLLGRRAGRVLRRDEVLTAIGRGGNASTPRVVDTHVKNIRKKLGSAGNMIETLRGVGYVLRPVD